MAENWFKFHTNALAKSKIHYLPDRFFRRWVEFMCVAQNHEGVLPPIDQCAFEMRISVSDCRKAYRELIDRKLIDEEDGVGTMHDWEQWQFQLTALPPASPIREKANERVKRYREKLKLAGGDINFGKKFRDLVLSRDGYQCCYCGVQTDLCLDHIVPVSLGGKTEDWNLITSCKPCSSGKSGRDPVEAGYRVINVSSQQIVTRAMRVILGRDTPIDTIDTPSRAREREEKRRIEERESVTRDTVTRDTRDAVEIAAAQFSEQTPVGHPEYLDSEKQDISVWMREYTNGKLGDPDPNIVQRIISALNGAPVAKFQEKLRSKARKRAEVDGWPLFELWARDVGKHWRNGK